MLSSSRYLIIIQQACDEFDKHHEYWKNEDCWHLVVVLAGYVDNPKDQKKIRHWEKVY